MGGGKPSMIQKIYVFTSEPFPVGMAATNRIISIARGFLFHQMDAEIIIIRKTERYKEERNLERQGTHRGIKFRYIANSPGMAASYLKRRLDNVFINWKLFLFSMRRLDKNTVAYYYATVTLPAIILWLTSRLKRSVLVKEESEHPEVYSWSRRFLTAFSFNRIHYRLFDGLLLMTNNLIAYFKNDKRYKKPILHVPMTVDVDRFQVSDSPRNKWITYCGILHDRKDGTSILLQAFHEVASRFPEYELVLIGDALSEEDRNRYQRMVEELGIKNKVTFVGKISSDQIPKYLMDSSLLVLPRPHSKQAQHGFPTKLGEYLASGNPVVVTSVGEIPDYLEDRISAYVAEPGDFNSLKEKMLEALSDYEQAKIIGLKGREVVLEHFNNTVQAKSIIDFINNTLC